MTWLHLLIVLLLGLIGGVKFTKELDDFDKAYKFDLSSRLWTFLGFWGIETAAVILFEGLAFLTRRGTKKFYRWDE